VKMMSECQTAWIWMRRRVTQPLMRIQTVCIWQDSCAWQAKGEADISQIWTDVSCIIHVGITTHLSLQWFK